MGIRKPGLWHGPRRVEVEIVTSRMGKECERCGDYPEDRRLVIEEGVGRGAKKTINCMVCGRIWLKERLQEAKRALRYFRTGQGSVRRA